MMSPGADVAQSQDHRIADLSLHAEIEVLRIRQHVVGLEARRARDGLELGPDACGSGAGNRKGEPLTGIVAATAVLVRLLQVHFCRADVEETKGRVAHFKEQRQIFDRRVVDSVRGAYAGLARAAK